MKREKLRNDMLRRLESRQDAPCGLSIEAEATRVTWNEDLELAIHRLREGLADPTRCPICFYLHGHEHKLVPLPANSPLPGDMTCEACGYVDIADGGHRHQRRTRH